MTDPIVCVGNRRIHVSATPEGEGVLLEIRIHDRHLATLVLPNLEAARLAVMILEELARQA